MRIRTLAACAMLALALAQPAFAHTTVFTTALSGPNEFPSNNSPGVGSSVVTIDFDLLTMRVQAEFSGLNGTTSAAHIHGPIPDPPANPLASIATETPTFVGFPLGVTAGSYDHTYDMTQAGSYNPSFITANGGTVGSAMNAFFTGMNAGKMYLNIHSSTVPGGEIRGFLVAVPEPATIGLAATGLVGLLWFYPRRRS